YPSSRKLAQCLPCFRPGGGDIFVLDTDIFRPLIDAGFLTARSAKSSLCRRGISGDAAWNGRRSPRPGAVGRGRLDRFGTVRPELLHPVTARRPGAAAAPAVERHDHHCDDGRGPDRWTALSRDLFVLFSGRYGCTPATTLGRLFRGAGAHRAGGRDRRL